MVAIEKEGNTKTEPLTTLQLTLLCETLDSPPAILSKCESPCPEGGTSGQGKEIIPMGPAAHLGCLAALPEAHVPLHHLSLKIIFVPPIFFFECKKINKIALLK